MVQGSAAELFKAWAATVRSRCRPLGAQIVLCLHDELLVHAPEPVAQDVATLLRESLTAVGARWAPPAAHGRPVRFVADVAVVRTALDSLAAEAGRTGDFQAGAPSIDVSSDGSVAILHLTTRYAEDDPRADGALALLRDRMVPDALGHRTAYVGGMLAEDHDATQLLRDRMPLVIGMVLLLTVVVMGLAFRSVPLALLTCVLNLASVGVAFGVLTLVFQHGFLDHALGFTAPGFLVDWLPLFVMVVLVGLSMDYHVFVLSRVREHVRNGLPPRLAVQRGIADTSGVVTSAAAVMVSVFAIFATLSMLEMKTMGVGLAVAILLDATLVRQVLLPAALVLLGERAWWPGRVTAPVGTPVEEPTLVAAELG